MTPRLSDKKERISPCDLAGAQNALDLYFRMCNLRTYAFHIASDIVPQREETQS